MDKGKHKSQYRIAFHPGHIAFGIYFVIADNHRPLTFMR
jgi:hypothetical protein